MDYDVREFSLKVTNHKCFGPNPQGLDGILPINIIVGRNNSGKSSLLDLIFYATSISTTITAVSPQAVLTMSRPLDEYAINAAFQKGLLGGGIPSDHNLFGQKFLGTRYSWEVHGTSQQGADPTLPPDVPNDIRERLAKAARNPLKCMRFKRILPGRDILPEQDSTDESVAPNGTGATNLVQRFLNKISHSQALVEVTLLKDLNTILQPDVAFTRIDARQHASGEWEVLLQEELKGFVPLSDTGHGVKTILLVLIYMHLVPDVEKSKLSDYVFAFEELSRSWRIISIRLS